MAGVLPRRDGHSSGTPVAGRLEQPTRATRPTDEAPPAAREPRAHRSYSVLLPAGLAVPPTLPPARCALAAPFHPYPCAQALRLAGWAVCFLWRYPWGRPRRTLSGAASVWSPDFPPLEKRRPSGRLAKRAYEREGAAVKEKRAVGSGIGGERRPRDAAERGPAGVHCSFTRSMGLMPPRQAAGLRARWRPVAFIGGEWF